MAYHPIWKDVIVPLPYNDQQPYTDYEIRAGSRVLFAGRAYNRPDPETGQFDRGASVRLNDVVAEYLKQSFIPDISTQQDAWAPAIMLDVQLYTGSTQRFSGTFYVDWSYDFARSTWGQLPLHDPVDFRLDGRQHVLNTSLTYYNVNFYLYNAAGAVTTVTVQSEPGCNCFIDLRPLSTDFVKLGMAGVEGEYTIDQGRCANRYVLHYVNAYGGWDSLLMSGEPVKSYGYDRKRFTHDYDNSDTENANAARGTDEFVNIVTTAWALRTGLLTTEQSARMHHVFGSTLVYLEDLERGEFFPVVITDSSHQVMTANTNGRRPIQYTVNVKLAAEQVRR